jgi:hypothetical protein
LLKKGVTPQGTPASGTTIEAARAAQEAAALQKKQLLGLNNSNKQHGSNNSSAPRPGFEGKGKGGKGFLNSKHGGSPNSAGGHHGHSGSKHAGPNPVRVKGK